MKPKKCILINWASPRKHKSKKSDNENIMEKSNRKSKSRKDQLQQLVIEVECNKTILISHDMKRIMIQDHSEIDSAAPLFRVNSKKKLVLIQKKDLKSSSKKESDSEEPVSELSAKAHPNFSFRIKQELQPKGRSSPENSNSRSLEQSKRKSFDLESRKPSTAKQSNSLVEDSFFKESGILREKDISRPHPGTVALSEKKTPNECHPKDKTTRSLSVNQRKPPKSADLSFSSILETSPAKLLTQNPTKKEIDLCLVRRRNDQPEPASPSPRNQSRRIPTGPVKSPPSKIEFIERGSITSSQRTTKTIINDFIGPTNAALDKIPLGQALSDSDLENSGSPESGKRVQFSDFGVEFFSEAFYKKALVFSPKLTDFVNPSLLEESAQLRDVVRGYHRRLRGRLLQARPEEVVFPCMAYYQINLVWRRRYPGAESCKFRNLFEVYLIMRFLLPKDERHTYKLEIISSKLLSNYIGVTTNRLNSNKNYSKKFLNANDTRSKFFSLVDGQMRGLAENFKWNFTKMKLEFMSPRKVSQIRFSFLIDIFLLNLFRVMGLTVFEQSPSFMLLLFDKLQMKQKLSLSSIRKMKARVEQKKSVEKEHEFLLSDKFVLMLSKFEEFIKKHFSIEEMFHKRIWKKVVKKKSLYPFHLHVFRKTKPKSQEPTASPVMAQPKVTKRKQKKALLAAVQKEQAQTHLISDFIFKCTGKSDLLEQKELVALDSYLESQFINGLFLNFEESQSSEVKSNSLEVFLNQMRTVLSLIANRNDKYLISNSLNKIKKALKQEGKSQLIKVKNENNVLMKRSSFEK